MANGVSLVDAIERFFFDLIGAVIPGALLIVGVVVVAKPDVSMLSGAIPPDSGGEWCTFVAASFALGHALTSFSQRILVPLLTRLIGAPIEFLEGWIEKAIVDGTAVRAGSGDSVGELRRGRRGRFLLRAIQWLLSPIFHMSRPFMPKEADPEKTTRELGYTAVRRHFARLDEAAARASGPSHYRSAAMSMLSTGEHQTVVRFMFVSLFNYGLASCMVLYLVLAPLVSTQSYWTYMAAVVLGYFFSERGRDFSVRTFRTPFAMALAHLPVPDKASSGPGIGVLLVAEKGDVEHWRRVLSSALPSSVAFRFDDPARTMKYRCAAVDWSMLLVICGSKLQSCASLVGYARGRGKQVLAMGASSQEVADQWVEGPFDTIARVSDELQAKLGKAEPD